MFGYTTLLATFSQITLYHCLLLNVSLSDLLVRMLKEASDHLKIPCADVHLTSSGHSEVVGLECREAILIDKSLEYSCECVSVAVLEQLITVLDLCA